MAEQNYFNKYLGRCTHWHPQCRTLYVYSPNFQLHRIRLENVLTTKCFVDSRLKEITQLNKRMLPAFAPCIPSVFSPPVLVFPPFAPLFPDIVFKFNCFWAKVSLPLCWVSRTKTNLFLIASIRYVRGGNEINFGVLWWDGQRYK